MQRDGPGLGVEMKTSGWVISNRSTTATSRYAADYSMDPRLVGVGYDGPLHLNVGSGVNPIPSAKNVDIQAMPGANEHWDFREPWPHPDNSFDKVTLFHCLEHVTPTQALAVAREAFRVLHPKGLLIAEVPDLDGMVRELSQGNYGMLVGPLYGGYDAPMDAHLFGYTASSLALLCHLAGFIRLVTGPGKDYHAPQMPTIRVEAVKVEPRNLEVKA